MTQKTVIKNFLQSATEIYYKVRQVLQSASGITKCDRLSLQSMSGITKRGSYYKVRRNSDLIQILLIYSVSCCNYMTTFLRLFSFFHGTNTIHFVLYFFNFQDSCIINS